VEQISCTWLHVLALADGAVYGWGLGSFGRLGTGTPQTSARPCRLQAFKDLHVRSVAAGREHSAAVDEHGRAWVWGNGAHARLGTGGLASRWLPTQLKHAGMPPLARVVCGPARTLFLARDGGLWVCGHILTHEPAGHLVPARERWTPTQLPRHAFCGARILATAAAVTFTAALTEHGLLYAWPDGVVAGVITHAAAAPGSAFFRWPAQPHAAGCNCRHARRLALASAQHRRLGKRAWLQCLDVPLLVALAAESETVLATRGGCILNVPAESLCTPAVQGCPGAHKAAALVAESETVLATRGGCILNVPAESLCTPAVQGCSGAHKAAG
jgi:hypothetical protein